MQIHFISPNCGLNISSGLCLGWPFTPHFKGLILSGSPKPPSRVAYIKPQFVPPGESHVPPSPQPGRLLLFDKFLSTPLLPRGWGRVGRSAFSGTYHLPSASLLPESPDNPWLVLSFSIPSIYGINLIFPWLNFSCSASVLPLPSSFLFFLPYHSTSEAIGLSW